MLIKKPLLGRQINPYHPLAQKLEGCWLLNEGGGNSIFNLGKDRGIGTFNGIPDWVASEQGTAIDFNGSTDYVSVPDSDNFSFGDGSNDSPFSICAWVKLLSYAYDPLVSKRNTVGGNLEYTLIAFSDSLYLLMYDYIPAEYILASTVVPASYEGKWVFWASTYDGSGSNLGISFYLNGLPVAVNTGSGGSYAAMHSGDAPVDIGYDGWTDTYSEGQFSTVYIYRKELTAGEVFSLHLDPYQFMEPIIDIGVYGAYEVEAIFTPKIIFF